MAKLLFKLHNVPEDEADEVRTLLEQAEIQFYETTAGNFGLSFAAIWLQDDQEFAKAKQLILDYQKERYSKAKEHYASLLESGQNLTYWQGLKLSPFKLPAAIIFIMFIAYFSVVPFFPA